MRAMIDLEHIRAIDIHTHAEEPCGMHADDGMMIYRQLWPVILKRPDTSTHYS